MGLDSPEQPDLIQRGPATAEGGCERQRALLAAIAHAGEKVCAFPRSSAVKRRGKAVPN